MSMRVLLLSLLVLAGCDEGVTGPKAPLNTDFVLAPGQSVVVESATMRFVSLSTRSYSVEKESEAPKWLAA